MVDLITKRFDCVLFDLGNTLIAQENPGTPYQDLKVQVLPGVPELLDELNGKVKLGIVSNTIHTLLNKMKVLIEFQTVFVWSSR